MRNLQDERDLLSKPGDTILETLEYLKMTQADLAERMGKTASKINDLISGKEPITIATAIQLERVLKIDAQFWLNRETLYREKLSRIEQEEALQECIEWLNEQPVKELRKMGYIKSEKNDTGMVEEMLKFYSVVSPNEWNSIYVQDYASTDFKKSSAYRNSLGAMAAFLRIGEIEMTKLNLGIYDKAKFKRELNVARILAFENPEDFAQQLKDLCKLCGVALIYSRSFPGAPISGATRWIGGNPLIQLTDRYKTNDHFWFAFFHEVAHILLHGKKEVFIEEFDGVEIDEAKELEADKFSEEILIPKQYLNKLLDIDNITEKDIKIVGREAEIHPGIIVGILQRLDKVSYKFGNTLKLKVFLDFLINKE
jgi:HTH-type transcriptional regulator/antitoxin HigA